MNSPQTIEQHLRQALYEAWLAVGGEKTSFKPEEIHPAPTEPWCGIHLEHPAEEKYGDYASNIALQMYTNVHKSSQIANKEYKNPLELAEAIVQVLNSSIINHQSSIIDRAEAAGPGFINIWIKKDWLVKQAERVLKDKDAYGKITWHTGETWVLEHTSPNPNKAMHLGHLRNNITGMAIGNIWQFLGINVIRDCIDNNRGIAIARLMWGYLKFAHKQGKEITDLNYWYEHQDEWLTPEEARLRPDRFVDEFYVKASTDFKESKEAEQRVRQMVVDWESEDKKTWALWEKVLNYSYQGQKMTLDRLGSYWDKVWHEHEHYKQGKEMVKLGLEKGIFRQLDNGAILSNLKDYKLTDTIIIKADGTALYITQDLALTKLKKDTFKPTRMFWVIGPEQSLALKQLFAICEQLGVGKKEEFTHIAYGYMSIKGQGKMSSRSGNVIYIDDLLDKASKKAYTLSSDESFNINYIDPQVKKLKLKSLKRRSNKHLKTRAEAKTVAEQVAIGAVKYSILKVGRMQGMAFDFDKSISLEGDSGPYLQYTYARTQSVLAKAQNAKLKTQNHSLKLKVGELNDEERAILRYLYRFPEVVKQAGEEYAPNVIANFLYDLAGRFNVFYNKHRILEGKNQKSKIKNTRKKSKDLAFSFQTSAFRLLLTTATGQVIKNGLTLLGIPAPAKM